MKITVSLTVLILAFCATCMAAIVTRNVTRNEAKELGVELRAKPNGPNEAWIELEFKPEGKLAEFSHVSLEILDGEKFQLGWTPLKDVRTSSGSILVRLMGNRTYLQNVTLRIVLGVIGGSGEDIRIKDFVDLNELR